MTKGDTVKVVGNRPFTGEVGVIEDDFDTCARVSFGKGEWLFTNKQNLELIEGVST